GRDQAELIAALTGAGIPVLAHLGLRPQAIRASGGYRVERDRDRLLADAEAVQQAGAFAVILECIPTAIAEEVTKHVDIPTIGIGAGIHCDGEIQVLHDILGLTPGPPFKHTRRFVEGREALLSALKEYADAVRERRFPTEENSF
ncbi:MAG: 3-methyl-2-oxobutanoate hydroxymethyltransferase, partial [Fimbriimonadales bacterium]|nr:3-methyl-2-oxobutanoate hydroxymethyltransferase [Fimbriimonadales bacterium]